MAFRVSYEGRGAAMAEGWKNQYWDSALFLAFLTRKEQDKHDLIRQLINDEYESGLTNIVISTAVLVELRPYMEITVEDKERLGERARKKLTTYRLDDAAVIESIIANPELDIRPLTVRIAQKAREIGRDHPQLTPMDCVHIATAIDAKVDVLFTWDGQRKGSKPEYMLPHDGEIDGLLIKEPRAWPKPPELPLIALLSEGERA